jgi:hypothetical protein
MDGRTAFGKVDFRVNIVPSSMVAINDLGHGIHEVLAVSPWINERRIVAQQPRWFALSGERLTLHPEGVDVAWQP